MRPWLPLKRRAIKKRLTHYPDQWMTLPAARFVVHTASGRTVTDCDMRRMGMPLDRATAILEDHLL